MSIFDIICLNFLMTKKRLYSPFSHVGGMNPGTHAIHPPTGSQFAQLAEHSSEHPGPYCPGGHPFYKTKLLCKQKKVSFCHSIHASYNTVYNYNYTRIICQTYFSLSGSFNVKCGMSCLSTLNECNFGYIHSIII